MQVLSEDLNLILVRRFKQITTTLNCTSNHRLAREPQLASHIKKDTKLGTTISDVVTSAASGMFLLVRLRLNALAIEDNRKSLRRAILRLPTDLNIMYDQIIQRIRTQIRQRSSRAEQIMSWLSYSIGPLTVVEL
jgi:hypothetical protein